MFSIIFFCASSLYGVDKTRTNEFGEWIEEETDMDTGEKGIESAMSMFEFV